MHLQTVNQFASDSNHPLTEQGVRHLIFHSEPRTAADGTEIPDNGFAEAFPKIGWRRYVNVPKFWEIVAKQNSREAA